MVEGVKVLRVEIGGCKVDTGDQRYLKASLEVLDEGVSHLFVELSEYYISGGGRRITGLRRA